MTILVQSGSKPMKRPPKQPRKEPWTCTCPKPHPHYLVRCHVCRTRRPQE